MKQGENNSKYTSTCLLPYHLKVVLLIHERMKTENSCYMRSYVGSTIKKMSEGFAVIHKRTSMPEEITGTYQRSLVKDVLLQLRTQI